MTTHRRQHENRHSHYHKKWTNEWGQLSLRIGETLALRLHDVDLDLLKVHVTRRQPDRAVTVRRATPRESPRAPARE